MAIAAMVRQQKMPSFHLRGISPAEMSPWSILLFNSLCNNKTIYHKITAFVYFMPISPKPNVISDWIERCSQLPVYFLIQCVSLRLIEDKEQKQKASSSLCLSQKKNIILIIYFWLEEK